MALTKDQIFFAKDAETVSFDVPEWGGSILLRPMTGKQRAEYEHWASQASKNDNDFRTIRERTILACAVDDSGEALFTFDDLEKLAEKNSLVLDRVSEECQKISGLLASSVEDAAKN